MSKEFLSYQQVRNNSLKLAHRMHTDGFTPDVIYVSLRGGAYVGNVISEYFKVVRPEGQRPVFYAALVAHSYSGVKEQYKIRVDGWTYSPEHLRQGDKILLIDDIFDSGRTINHLVEVLLEKGVPRRDIKIAVHDYKVRTYLSNQLPIQPDYFCRKHLVSSPTEDNWIHYLSHELVGLTDEEIEHNYADDQEVVALLKQLRDY
ncbi:phosphoribosyltransferase [Spirochaeta lutea]|uniref:Phosphoribosyl transferase n=1 Tax=Spirochaeta lutea TaxID=1480694 RepID=A0A098R0M6_9SPIO|nr:phosphoribosyltransferase [Spirochaeta lutea]KGE73715.1 phosphoribosyl transferase [Spirochaeta lutea]